jgi:selenide,water dikinase
LRATTCDRRRHVAEDELLAGAKTSGGLLMAGQVPGYPVVGELLLVRGDGITGTVR